MVVSKDTHPTSHPCITALLMAPRGLPESEPECWDGDVWLLPSCVDAVETGRPPRSGESGGLPPPPFLGSQSHDLEEEGRPLPSLTLGRGWGRGGGVRKAIGRKKRLFKDCWLLGAPCQEGL